MAKYVLKERNWLSIEQYLFEQNIISIDLVLKEVLNTIWKHFVLLRNYDQETAFSKKKILFELIENNIIVIEPEEKYLNRAFNISIQNKITIYDALYIAQAILHEASLLTSDKGQARAARNLGVNTIYVP